MQHSGNRGRRVSVIEASLFIVVSSGRAAATEEHCLNKQTKQNNKQTQIHDMGRKCVGEIWEDVQEGHGDTYDHASLIHALNFQKETV